MLKAWWIVGAALGVCLVQGPVAGATLERQRETFLQAERALAAGRPAEARRLVDALEDYPLRPYLWFEILDAVPDAEQEIPDFLARYGHTRYAPPLRAKWLKTLAQRGAWAEYVRAYRDTREVAAQCDYYFALHQLGRRGEAWVGAARLWDAGVADAPACDRLFAVFQASPAFTPEHLWNRLAAALTKNRLDLAVRLRDLVPPPDRAWAEFWLKVHGDPTWVERCDGWQPGQPLAARIFVYGIERLAAQDPLRSQLVWSVRRSEFGIPPSEQVRVDRRLALALATQRYPQALAYLGALPEPAVDARVRAWRVRGALLQRDWRAALEALDQLAATEQRQTQWRYWRARALDALGEGAAAAEIYRQLAEARDFYGFLAADRVGQAPALSFLPAEAKAADLERLANSEPLRAIQEFRALNRNEEARKEWLQAIQILPREDLALAARLAQSWGWNRLAILTLAKAERWDDLALRFPLAYASQVEEQARARRLDPAALFGLIRRESAFDPEARSPAGALGLMQLLPGTGEEVARMLAEPWQSARSLLIPEINLRYGAAYFRSLLDRFGSHLALAAAAYNAGPYRVDRWLPAEAAVPADVWIETIPVDETRQYVAAIVTYAAIYRERLGRPRVRISDLLPDIAPSDKALAMKPDRPQPVQVCP
ncbi:transglycosylase SLT domain-containing protein [Candidatus Methylocalor cossyra]|uniref:Soluble lytic murein transglycosylase n=1 Tax=Candidatus Methylocalor cossyra TaxID=3108543 RepID=A0ABM9NJF7_9GAMM